MSSKYKIEAVFEYEIGTAKESTRALQEIREYVKKFNGSASSKNYPTISVKIETEDEFLVNALGYMAAANNMNFYFIITNNDDTFYTNDVDGKYFSTLYFVEANLPSGFLQLNFDSELEIIDDIEIRLGKIYQSLNQAVKAINKFCKSKGSNYYYNVYDYEVLDPDNWTEVFARIDVRNNQERKK